MRKQVLVAGILLVALALLITAIKYIAPDTIYVTPTLAPTPTPTPTPIASPTPISTPEPISSPGSCPTFEKSSPPPSGIGGWQQPRDLTEEEKARVVQIAVNSPEASDWLQSRTDYQVSPVDLYGIEWHDGKFGGWVMLEYPIEYDEIPCWVSPYAYWYPGVTIRVGGTAIGACGQEDIIIQMQIVVDLDAGKTVMVEGPYPPPGQNINTTCAGSPTKT